MFWRSHPFYHVTTFKVTNDHFHAIYYNQNLNNFDIVQGHLCKLLCFADMHQSITFKRNIND